MKATIGAILATTLIAFGGPVLAATTSKVATQTITLPAAVATTRRPRRPASTNVWAAACCW